MPDDEPPTARNASPAQPGASVLVTPRAAPEPQSEPAAAKADEVERRVPAAVSVPPAFPPALVEALVARGDTMMDRRDISAASLPYEREAAASFAGSATKPHPPPSSGASPSAVAALLARGDALIAIGNVAAARLVYQRAAAHASGRAATATGKTYDPRFLQAIGAIGVVADPDAAAAWYRRGSALGDEDAAPLLSGLEVKASR